MTGDLASAEENDVDNSTDDGCRFPRARPADEPMRLGVTPEFLGASLLIAGICVGATLLPLRLSARRLEQMEW